MILSDNPLAIPVDKLDELRVVETIKEGSSIFQRTDRVSSLSSPAMFGITLNKVVDVGRHWRGGNCVCGDGCFNHGLRVLVNAIEDGQ